MDIATLSKLQNIHDNMIVGNIESAHEELYSLLEKENEKKTKCPFCAEEMQGFELIHYKCKKCNQYFTN